MREENGYGIHGTLLWVIGRMWVLSISAPFVKGEVLNRILRGSFDLTTVRQ